MFTAVLWLQNRIRFKAQNDTFFCGLQGLLMFTSLEVNNRKVICCRMLKIEFNDPQENLSERTKLHVSFKRSEDTCWLLF